MLFETILYRAESWETGSLSSCNLSLLAIFLWYKFIFYFCPLVRHFNYRNTKYEAPIRVSLHIHVRAEREFFSTAIKYILINTCESALCLFCKFIQDLFHIALLYAREFIRVMLFRNGNADMYICIYSDIYSITAKQYDCYYHSREHFSVADVAILRHAVAHTIVAITQLQCLIITLSLLIRVIVFLDWVSVCFPWKSCLVNVNSKFREIISEILQLEKYCRIV